MRFGQREANICPEQAVILRAAGASERVVFRVLLATDLFRGLDLGVGTTRGAL